MSVGFNFDDLPTLGVNGDKHHDASSRRLPRLDTSIHPLWQQKNFRRGILFDEIDYLPIFGEEGWDDAEGNFPDDLYDRILPALQLATLLLERARPFFVKVMFAAIRPTPRGSVFATDYHPTPTQRSTAYDANLLHIASAYRIFTEGSLGSRDGGNDHAAIFGLTQATPDPEFPVLGALTYEFFAPFRSSPSQSHSPQPALDATTLLLATTLVHELAHAILLHRLSTTNAPILLAGHEIDPEPLFTPSDPTIELGEALEHFLFDGTLHLLGCPDSDPDSLDLSANFGLAWAPWVAPDPARHDSWLPADADALFWPVSAASIHALFDTHTWTRPSIELAPARAVSVAVEGCEGNMYETLFLLRLLTVRKGMAVPRNRRDGGRSSDAGMRRSRSPRSRRLVSPRNRPPTSPRSRRSASPPWKTASLIPMFFGCSSI